MADRTLSHADRRLADIIREVKVETAERDDVVVDMKEADQARLDLLAEKLRPIFDEVPDEVDVFDFAISRGLEPRLWIDAVAHVQMGRDRRTYRFVRDTRLGRVILAENADPDPVVDSISRYIAERLIERERILEGDMETLKAFYQRVDDGLPHSGSPNPKMDEQKIADSLHVLGTETEGSSSPTPDDAPEGVITDGSGASDEAATKVVGDYVKEEPQPAKSRRGDWTWFILACLAGGGALLVAFWDRILAALT